MRALCLLLLHLALPATAAGEPVRDPALRDIPYLTSREIVAPADDATRYGNDVGALSAGVCEVLLPASRDARPSTGAFRALPVEDVIRRFDEPGISGLLVYIHGYNIGIDRACRDAARLARATGREDRILLFSWPASQAGVTYRRDEQRLAESTPAILAALRALGERHGHENISIVAHSMGSRVVLALATDDSWPRQARLDDLILVAPDVDREAFLGAAAKLRERVREISILVYEDDRLLKLSEIANRGERLGQDTDAQIDGVSVIDVAELGDLGFTGHIYHLHSQRVGELLQHLLRRDGT
jgi:pimeloyl-ACP methyl ester carboxylesterase